MSDPLKELLRRADAAAGPPPEMQGDLAGRARALARRRRTARMIVRAAAVAATAVGLGILAMQFRTGGPGRRVVEETPTSSAAEIAELRAEIARLNAEAESRMAVVRRMLAAEANYKLLAELRRELAKPTAAERMRRQIDRAAFVMVYQADHLMDPEDDREAVAATYRRVVELFGQTAWADVARRRLQELQKS